MKSISSREYKELVIQKAITPDLGIAKEVYRFEPTPADNVLKFVFSSKSVDLSGDRVFPTGIDFKGYFERNPIILLHHDLHQWGIGKTIALDVVDDKLIGTIEFFTDLEEDGIGSKARAAVELVKRGVMGISITFIPKQFELNATDGLDIIKCQMVESSVVTVPCNTDSYLVQEEDRSRIMVASVPDASDDELEVAKDAGIRTRKALRRFRVIALQD